MTAPATDHGKLVLLLPEAFARGVFDPQSRPLLELWRDGKIRLVVNRWLVVRYLKALAACGVPSRLIRWWAWWLTNETKVSYQAHVADSTDPSRIVSELAATPGLSAVIGMDRSLWAEGQSGPSSPPRLPVAEFLELLKAGG